MTVSLWPKEVKIRARVGRHNWYQPHPRYGWMRVPCCAAGCCFEEFDISHLQKSAKEYKQFEKAYIACYRAKFPKNPKYLSIEACNDEIPTATARALIYNAAWALLGYTEGQSPEVLKLAAKAAEKAKK